MQDSADIETDQFQRIVALLFSLARLADRAANRSFLVRAVVLWVLRRAEPAAWSYVFGDCDYIDWLPAYSNDRASARRLARTFRMLARALRNQIRSFESLSEPPRRDAGPLLAALFSLRAATIADFNLPALIPRLDSS